MNIIIFYKVAGVFIILVDLGFTISQVGITKIFNYPQILRSPIHVILERFYDGGVLLKFFWTCFALSSLMLIPMSGIFYVLGLMRWVLLADNLSKKYIHENTNPRNKEIYEMIFQAFHIYCGNSIGETMGFICMGLWISITGISIIGSLIILPFIGVGFIVCGIGISAGPLEWLGLKHSNRINKLSMKILMCFLIYLGISLIIY